MKKFEIRFTIEADLQLSSIEEDPSKKAIFKAVCKTLALMELNIRHPSLRTHEFTTLSRELGTKVFESYAQNNTPGAYRIFWHYGPKKSELTVIAIVPHP